MNLVRMLNLNRTNVKERFTLPQSKANKIEQLQKERKQNVNVIKSSIPAIKELMQQNENILAVRIELESLVQVFEEAIELHDSVIPLLPSDE